MWQETELGEALRGQACKRPFHFLFFLLLRISFAGWQSLERSQPEERGETRLFHQLTGARVLLRRSLLSLWPMSFVGRTFL